MTRRELLIAGAAGASLAGCSASHKLTRRYTSKGAVPMAEQASHENVRRLNRLSYGPRPGDLAAVEKQGWEAYVDEQLAANQEEPLDLQLALRGLDIFQFSAADLRNLPEHKVIEQLQAAAILRAVYSPNQLRERMVEFWSDHFNIDSKKAYGAFYLASDQNSVIRKHALGNFGDMVRASAHSPAMLGYLDNKVNQKGRVNENYGRELLELHTLGVRGGYTQKDVLETARCFTGWSVEDGFLKPRGQFIFRESVHDEGPYEVLGTRIPGGIGKKAGERVLDLAVAHPGTAKHIGGKLAKFFLGSQPGPWPDRLADIYMKTQGDIKAMLRPMLLSEELTKPSNLTKRPYDYMISALRAVEADTQGTGGVQAALAAMGQPLHHWAMPDGYPMKTSAWTASMLGRWNFALKLASGGVSGVAFDLDGLIQRTGLSPRKAIAALVFGDPEALLPMGDSIPETLALALASPQFQWR